jgi:hypothetical protein
MELTILKKSLAFDSQHPEIREITANLTDLKSLEACGHWSNHCGQWDYWILLGMNENYSAWHDMA